MAEIVALDPVLQRLRAVLSEMYQDRLARVVLFGSRARGDARPDSDYDVAVFLKSIARRRDEWDRLADLRLQFIYDTGDFFDLLPFEEHEIHHRTPLMHEIRLDGIDL